MGTAMCTQSITQESHNVSRGAHSILVLFRLTETCVAPINVEIFEIFEILKTSIVKRRLSKLF